MTPSSLRVAHRVTPAIPLVVLLGMASLSPSLEAAPGRSVANVVAGAIALQPPAADKPAVPEGFEPVSALPAAQREQIPAAPIVMVAYAFVWAMILAYLWSIWRRLGAVEKELASVARRVDEAGRR